jgi:hypothetical protein
MVLLTLDYAGVEISEDDVFQVYDSGLSSVSGHLFEVGNKYEVVGYVRKSTHCEVALRRMDNSVFWVTDGSFSNAIRSGVVERIYDASES